MFTQIGTQLNKSPTNLIPADEVADAAADTYFGSAVILKVLDSKEKVYLKSNITSLSTIKLFF